MCLWSVDAFYMQHYDLCTDLVMITSHECVPVVDLQGLFSDESEYPSHSRSPEQYHLLLLEIKH